MNRSMHPMRVVVACAVAATGCFGASAQAPAPAPASDAAAPAAVRAGLEELSWLRGCWGGNVNRRDFVEHWLPPRAGMMVGVSHTIVQAPKHAGESRTEDYTYLRLEARADGVYYIAIPSGKKELPFKLSGVESDKGDKVFTFTGPGDAFPQRIVYRHTEAGSLFAQVGGKVDGKEKDVTYPMYRVDCSTGERSRE
jgi:hypothetical protein